jgi:hypothetical protein
MELVLGLGLGRVSTLLGGVGDLEPRPATIEAATSPASAPVAMACLRPYRRAWSLTLSPV